MSEYAADGAAWAVTVSMAGKAIVTIEPRCLAGREISPVDESAIRTAAHHLLGFIGDPYPSCDPLTTEALEPFVALAKEILAKQPDAPDDGWLVITTASGGIIDTSQHVFVRDLRRVVKAFASLTARVEELAKYAN